MANPRFNALFHRRWAVPIMAVLDAGRGAKLVTLENSLGVGRETLKATLEALIEQGLVERNPGYGHPMRPEYLLSVEGQRIAPFSDRLVATVGRLGIEPLAFRKWTMPLTLTIGNDERRFGEIRDDLAGITPRALTLSLKDMQQSELIVREVYDDYPPVTSYRLHRRARPVLAILQPLAEAV